MDHRTQLNRLGGLLLLGCLCLAVVEKSRGDCLPAPSGLAGWWTGDNTAQTENGTSHGTLQNGASYAIGKVGDAFYFDGINDFVSIPASSSLNASNAITLAAWVRHGALGTSVQRYLTLSPEKAQIRYDGLAGFHFSIKVGGSFYQLRPDLQPQVNRFYFIAGTYDGLAQKLFVDGALVASQVVTGTLDPATSSGVAISASGEAMNGIIDEAAIFNRALTAAEIQNVYNAASAGMCKELKIRQHPQHQTVFAGEDATFSVDVAGGQPFQFQWKCNGKNLIGETRSSLLVGKADFVESATFSVTVANPISVVTSSNALLSVTNTSGVLTARLKSNQECELTLRGPPGMHCIQTSTNLMEWTPITTVTNVGGAITVSEVRTNFQRYYRTVKGPCFITSVDSTTLHGKVLCGYNGWFRCPGDDTNLWAGWPQNGTNMWIHWSGDWNQITTNSLTFEMWPDMSDYGFSEKFAAPGFTYSNGGQAHLFSSVNPKTIDRHFDWMRDYGIDGVFLERFVIDTTGRPWMTNVIKQARAAANRTGRTFAIAYDMALANPTNVYNLIVNDWKRLVDVDRITSDPRYLHHDGKPVLLLWGFYTNQLSSATLGNQIIDFFKTNSAYRVTLIGGGDWWWRSNSDTNWAAMFRRFDVICPWNVGNYYWEGTNGYARTSNWADDIAAAGQSGMLYMPVIYPGFGWDNLKRLPPGTTKISRLHGDFFWRQFHDAANLGIDMVFVAMFDEVDEGTAIFKVTNDPPQQHYFQTFEGMPSDWYLRLTGEGTKVIRGERPNTRSIPILP